MSIETTAVPALSDFSTDDVHEPEKHLEADISRPPPVPTKVSETPQNQNVFVLPTEEMAALALPTDPTMIHVQSSTERLSWAQLQMSAVDLNLVQPMTLPSMSVEEKEEDDDESEIQIQTRESILNDLQQPRHP